MKKELSRSWIVNAALPVHYQVRMVDGLFDLENRALVEAGSTRRKSTPRRLVVIDSTVDELYGLLLRRYLTHHGVKYHILSLPVSETDKTMESVFSVV